MNKIIRTICIFTENPDIKHIKKLKELKQKLSAAGYAIQTERICAKNSNFGELEKIFTDQSIYLSVGTKDYDYIEANINQFYTSRDNLNIELSHTPLELKHANILFNIINNCPGKTFNFTYVFNNAPSSPFMPSATFLKEGFAVGLQPTNLAANEVSIEEWFKKMKNAWNEINDIFKNDEDYLGIDTSIAPLFEGDSSLVHLIKRFYGDFNSTVVSDIYTQITTFIKGNNQSNVGLCGLMFPCLEDFELAREYEKGNFSLERNIFLSLHSGLGIDTYPIGVNEKPEKIVTILKLIQALSNKYNKPLSVRFVSDGKAKIGDKTDFRNKYLYDISIKAL